MNLVKWRWGECDPTSRAGILSLMEHPPRESQGPTLSLCMIAKNESHCIRNALESASSLFSEFILVDTGSCDDTAIIAQEFGATVIHQPWMNDFSFHRNTSLSHATGDWILVLDADEVIDESQHKYLRELLQGEKKCYQFIQRHYTNDHRLSRFQPARGSYPHREKQYVGFFDSYLCRLFPNNPKIRYENCVHELVEPSILREHELQLEKCSIILHHYGNTPELIERKKRMGLYAMLGELKLKEQPEEWKNLFELGVEHNTGGRLTESAEYFQKALVLNPENISISVNLGFVLTELCRFQESEDVLLSALQRVPHSPEALCNLAVNYMRQDKEDLAIPHLRKAIALNPNYINAYANLGRAFFKIGATAEGTQAYEQGIVRAPRNSKILLQFAVSLLDVGILKEARTVLEAVIRLSPDDAPGWQLMAVALERLGLPKEAKFATEKVETLLADTRSLKPSSTRRGA